MKKIYFNEISYEDFEKLIAFSYIPQLFPKRIIAEWKQRLAIAYPEGIEVKKFIKLVPDGKKFYLMFKMFIEEEV